MSNAKDPRELRRSPDIFTDDGGAHFTLDNLDRHTCIALARICATDSRLWPLGYVLGQMLFPGVETDETTEAAS